MKSCGHMTATKNKPVCWSCRNPDRMREYKRKYKRTHPGHWRNDYFLHKDRFRRDSMKSYRRHRAERLVAMREYAKRRPAWSVAKARAAARRRLAEMSPEKKRALINRIVRWKRETGKGAAYNVKRRAIAAKSKVIQFILPISVFRRDRWICYLCGCRCTKKTVSLDHVLPLCRGGAHSLENVRTACRRCNSSKHSSTIEEYVARCREDGRPCRISS